MFPGLCAWHGATEFRRARPAGRGGCSLDVPTLLAAYSAAASSPGSARGNPLLWWSPGPAHGAPGGGSSACTAPCERPCRSFWPALPAARLRFDTAVRDRDPIAHCADSGRRKGASGTWILPAMATGLPGNCICAGHAHSVETWVGRRAGQGGLYCVAIGRAVFGESMFSRCRLTRPRLALAGLWWAFCRVAGHRRRSTASRTRPAPRLARRGAKCHAPTF